MTTQAPTHESQPTTNFAAFMGTMGMVASLAFACIGSAYGMAKAGVAVCSIGINNPDKLMKSLIPVIMAGMIGIYGVLISIILVSTKIPTKPNYPDFQGILGLGGGLACGLSGLAAGIAIGVVGDSGIRASAVQQKVFTPMIVVLVFSEALGIFGVIIGIIAINLT